MGWVQGVRRSLEFRAMPNLRFTHLLNPFTAKPGSEHDIAQRVTFQALRNAAEESSRNGVGVEVYYPLSLHQQECFRFLGYRAGDFPVSEAAAREVVALPMFPEITAEQQERTISVCAAYLRQRLRLAA